MPQPCAKSGNGRVQIEVVHRLLHGLSGESAKLGSFFTNEEMRVFLYSGVIVWNVNQVSPLPDPDPHFPSKNTQHTVVPSCSTLTRPLLSLPSSSCSAVSDEYGTGTIATSTCASRTSTTQGTASVRCSTTGTIAKQCHHPCTPETTSGKDDPQVTGVHS